MATKKKALQAAAGAATGGGTFIEDVFSTYLYTGNGSTQTITNGIDLAGEGGLVWFKSRSGDISYTYGHLLFDTERGVRKALFSNLNNAEEASTTEGLTSFNSDGFGVTYGLGNDLGYDTNRSSIPTASWTFRKAPRFFDVVTYTGTGSSQAIPHNLGTEVGAIFVKETNGTANWSVYHRNILNTQSLYLNLTNAATTSSAFNATATDTVFYVDSSPNTNTLGSTYVAYLFAHDPLGPSGDGSDGLIACGSFTTSGSGNAVVDLGWEPSWLMIKRSSGTGNWEIRDDMRGFGVGASTDLKANVSDAESAPEANKVFATARGFEANVSSSSDYIYIAIRRGPMRVPESGTEVFAIDRADANGSATNPEFVAGFPVDHAILKGTGGTGSYFSTRLIAPGWGDATTTAAYTTTGSQTFDFQDGWYENSLNNTFYSWMFRRAPNFFDVVAYTGDGVAGRTVPHNLGVAPEMMIVKNRSALGAWTIYHSALGASAAIFFDDNAPVTGTSHPWNNTAPTDTNFTTSNSYLINGSGGTYIAHLFATLAGVSKVGTYTGNGTENRAIDCGFTAGARFVILRRLASSSDWFVFDTARGITTSADPFLKLNTTAAEDTNDDWIEPNSSGFAVNSIVNGSPFNDSGTDYIYLAIA